MATSKDEKRWRARGLRGGSWLAAWVAACAVLTACAAGWPTDNRIERWVAQLGPDPGWELLLDRFGGDEIALLRARFAPRPDPLASATTVPTPPRVGADSPPAAEKTLRARVCALADELAALPAVAAVTHPWNLGGASEPLARIAERPAARALDLARATPPRADLLVRVQSTATTAERAALFRLVSSREDDFRAAGLELLWAGHPLVAAALDLESRRVERVFAPLLVVVAGLGTALFLRSAVLAVAALLPALVTSSGVRAALRAAGIPSDLILVACGPLAFVILLASALHLVTAYRRLRARHSPPAAARAARREKLAAGALAALTTAAGFAAFLESGLRSVATLGLAMALSVPAGVALMYLFLPPLLAGCDTGPPRAAERARRRFWSRLAVWARRRRVAVRAALFGLLLAAPLCARGLRSETNALQYFPRDHRARSHFAALEAEGASLSTVEVLARAATPWSPAALEGSGLGTRLRAVPGVTGVFGPEVVLDDLEQTAGALGRVLAPGILRTAGRVDSGAEWARWTVRFPTSGSEATRALCERVEAAARSAIGPARESGGAVAAGPRGRGPAGAVSEEGRPDGPEIVVTGSVPRMLGMQSALVETLLVSLSLTLLATSLLFVLVARRPPDLAAAVVTNLVPVAAVLCAARLLAVPLDGATVLVAALVLALAVDNTLHLLHAGGGRRGRPDPRVRLRAFDRVGQPAAVSSVALVLGFASLALSGFAPTARFGLLCAIGSAAALAGDLIVLPVLWIRVSRPGGRRPSVSGIEA